MKLAVIMMTALPMTGCVIGGTSETERTLCRELARDLPTASTQDTLQTREELADYLDVFYSICPEG